MDRDGEHHPPPSAGEGACGAGGRGGRPLRRWRSLSRPSLTRGPPSPAEGARSGGSLQTITLREGADLHGFRAAARRLAAASVPPDRVVWSIGHAPGLFGQVSQPESGSDAPLSLPRAVADLIRKVVPHRDPERYALLYTLIWRITHGERGLMEVGSDPLVHRLDRMRKAIARDLHKMHAFLRFRRTEADGVERFVAWFEPDHHILEAATTFFVSRFRSLHWTILTPDGSAHWDGETLTFGLPGRREDAPEADGFEAGWRDYYESTFNPARTNLAAMRAEMPKKYWRNMPETAAILASSAPPQPARKP